MTAVVAVALPSTVLFMMEPGRSGASDDVPGVTAERAEMREGPAPSCCYDDADWRGDEPPETIDFSDPSSGAIIPLMKVDGR